MAKKTAAKRTQVEEFRHSEAKRKNNPPAKIAAEGRVPTVPKAQYAYSPRRPPSLRFDSTGNPDKLPELLAAAKERPLTDDEVRMLSEALRHEEPWLEWAGKQEQQRRGLVVDPVALHIHERVSAQAILKVAARQDVERSLFADPEQEYHEAVQFYRHDIDWTNRLILGDSLQVMSSLAHREDLAGKVQMIYMDPPYGIKFGSNFQPQVGQKNVKDKDVDLTRELEMVRAYRDTWHLGVHSYLSYLRDRLIVARELLTDSGSLFVQISDENLHRVRQLLDEIFGTSGFVAVINVAKTSGLAAADRMAITCDYILWYCVDRNSLRYHQLYSFRDASASSGGMYNRLMLPNGEHRSMTLEEKASPARDDHEGKVFRIDNLTKPGPGSKYDVEFEGKTYTPGSRWWGTTPEGMNRLNQAARLTASGNSLSSVRYWDDFPVQPLNNLWTDMATGGFLEQKLYVVQTRERIIERCILMSTNPGDLVMDPTCGSGTTAYVAEQWGRRWITIDTSRVAVAIARQRLMTAKLDRYRLAGEEEWNVDNYRGVDPSANFIYKTVAHVTLGAIARNAALDPIFHKHEPNLDAALAASNQAAAKIDGKVRQRLIDKLAQKLQNDGARAVIEADRRRWLLPGTTREEIETAFATRSKLKPKHVAEYFAAVPPDGRFEHWHVPFDTDPDWPKPLAEAVIAYRAAWRAKMDEVNECIADNAEQETLVDKPEVITGIVRVSGPFTVEAVQPPEMSLGDATVVESEQGGLFGGEPDQVDSTFMAVRPVEVFEETQNIAAYLEQMLAHLKRDGVRFPNNRQMMFTRLEALFDSGTSTGLHAEGRWAPEGQPDDDPDGPANVCVTFGPQYGPITAMQVEDTIRDANRAGYDDLVVAGFSFDGPAQAVIAEPQHRKLRIHMAHIRPDINPGMDGLLKDQPGSQLFTVFGQPRTTLQGPDKRGEYRVVMEGVDIYNPVDNSITPTKADKVAAWFLDSDYDGRTFCITQAFFPDRSAWEKLKKALGGVIDEDRFDALSGTESLPFPAGKHKAAAVKVIDPRGNEVMCVHRLNETKG